MALAKKLTAMKKAGKFAKTKGSEKVERSMSEFKAGELHSGSKTGPVVRSRKQAIAIGLSEQRKKEAGGYE